MNVGFTDPLVKKINQLPYTISIGNWFITVIKKSKILIKPSLTQRLEYLHQGYSDYLLFQVLLSTTN
jgi:hypothetical protein